MIRLRISFASNNIPLTDFHNGFAFDNVIVRNRTRNVLLETMTNIGHPNIEAINNASYQLIFQTNLNKDVTMLQYHMESPNANDLFYLHNETLGRNRAYEYASPAGRAFIDGFDQVSTYTTENLTAADFEQDMLETPKFLIEIDTFIHINGTFTIRATVEAKDNMPLGDYRIYTVISEDSLYYPNGNSYNSPLLAVVRENDQFHTNVSVNTANLFNRTWAPNETQSVEFIWDHTRSGFINYRSHLFQAVVFIQNTDTKEIFQVESTRDLSGFQQVGINSLEAEAQLSEIQQMKLFPNPAHDYFHLQFDQALKQDYQWKLVNMQGVEIKQGTVRAGSEQVTVDGLDYPAGAYILLLYNENVFVQRQVVLGRP